MDLLSFIESIGGDLGSLFSGAGSDTWSLLSGLPKDALALFGGSGANPLAAILSMLSVFAQGYLDQQKAGFAQNFSQEQLNAMEAATNPAKLNNLVQSVMQGLNATQRQAILGPAESAAAARGMATSPGQMQVIDEEALAPYVQNEERMAIDEVLRGLGLPFQARPQWPNLVAGGYAGDSGGSLGDLLGLPSDPSALTAMLEASGLDPTQFASLWTGGVF